MAQFTILIQFQILIHYAQKSFKLYFFQVITDFLVWQRLSVSLVDIPHRQFAQFENFVGFSPYGLYEFDSYPFKFTVLK